MADNEKELVLYLPSNSKNDFHKNKTSHFITVLPRHIDVEQGSECALTEIIYSNRFLNIYDPINKIKLTLIESDLVEGGRYRGGVIHTCRIKPGYYKTPESLVEGINRCWPKSVENYGIRITYDKVTDSTKLHVPPRIRQLTLHPYLAAMLGFETRTVFESEEWNDKGPDLTAQPEIFRSPQSMNIRLSCFAFFIYSNIIEYTRVGDTMVPLLAIINTDSSLRSDEIHFVVERPQFIKLNTTLIQNIEIKITDAQGDLIKFRGGNCILKLVIRRNVKANT